MATHNHCGKRYISPAIIAAQYSMIVLIYRGLTLRKRTSAQLVSSAFFPKKAARPCPSLQSFTRAVSPRQAGTIVASLIRDMSSKDTNDSDYRF